MKRLVSMLGPLAILLLAGCAGGWRDGQAPGGYAPPSSAHWTVSPEDQAVWVTNPNTVATAPGVTPAAAPQAAAAPAAAATPAATGTGTQALADGAMFRYKGAASSVNVAGEFNAWSTSADAMTKGADGVWTLKKSLAPGRYAYKFVINGSDWKPDEAAAESVDDGFGGKNSVVVVGGAGAAATPAPAAPAAAATPAATGTGTQALADGAMFRYKGAASSVNVAGEFNAWSTSADAMTKGADGVWTLKKSLAPGRYAYKFVINGSDWKPDEAAAESVDDGFGGKNSVVVVGGAGAAATPAPAAPAAAATPAATGTGTQALADGAMFRYKGAASSVNVAGEFNAWSTSADAMTKGADGVWTLKKSLAPGRYAYKFVINGSDWKPDEAAAESVDDGFGGKNSVVVVGGAGAAATPAPAAPAPSAAGPLGVGRPPEITRDGVRFTFGGMRASSVSLAGDFNGWATNLDPLTQGADGSWTLVKKLTPGTHQYKFVVDGSTWKRDEQNPATADDGLGGTNSVVVVK